MGTVTQLKIKDNNAVFNRDPLVRIEAKLDIIIEQLKKIRDGDKDARPIPRPTQRIR